MGCYANLSQDARAQDALGENMAAERLIRRMSVSPQLNELRGVRPAILPSLLLCDFGRLNDEIAQLEAAGVPALHLDVMDGHFVPNLTYGLPIVQAARRATRLPLDVHLMIANPDRFVDRYCQAGADLVTVHWEACADPRATLERVRENGAWAGLAIKPDTPVESAYDLFDSLDVLLIMSVEPGFGGQAFDRSALDKLRAASRAKPARVLLEVDGGVNRETIAPCAEAGADLFVIGSAIFRGSDYRASVADLAGLARSQTVG